MTTSLKGMISAFLSTRRLRNLSPNTIIFYCQHLSKFMECMESHYPDVSLEQIDHNILREYVSGLKENHSAGGVIHYIKVLKILFKFMVEEGVLFITKFGDPLARRMTNKMIERIGEKAKVKNIRLSACTFRQLKAA
jgi:site-specific recombinase XerD